MLAKMCGWNEPERVQSQQVSIQVDAKLLEELRKGHEQLVARQKSMLLASVVADTPGGEPRQFPRTLDRQGKNGSCRKALLMQSDQF
jgi:hypothetical protein